MAVAPRWITAAGAWSRSALGDFVAACSHEAAAMREALTWVVADALAVHRASATAVEEAIAAFGMAADRSEDRAARSDIAAPQAPGQMAGRAGDAAALQGVVDPD